MSANPYTPSPALSPEPVPAIPAESAELATLWERFAGSIIDTVFLFVLVFPVTFVVGFAIGMTAGTETVPLWVFQVVGWAAGIGGFLLLHGYLLATRGQTIGKLLMKTQIVDRTTNQIPPFGPLLLKRYLWVWLATMIPYAGRLIAIVNVLFIFRENRACLHDDVAGTKVIKLAGPLVPASVPRPGAAATS